MRWPFARNRRERAEDAAEPEAPAQSRRQLLTLGAAAAGAAAVAMLPSGSAEAGTGDGGSFDLGEPNTAPSSTSLNKTAGDGQPALNVTNTGTGWGVYGASEDGFGVHGESHQGTAVRGGTDAIENGWGVLGESPGPSAAVRGQSGSGRGVIGVSTSEAGTAGYSVENVGVRGRGDLNAGVVGYIGEGAPSAPNGTGVAGFGKTAGLGVYGESEGDADNGHGVLGRAQGVGAGVVGESNLGTGVRGGTDAEEGGWGVLGESPGPWAAVRGQSGSGRGVVGVSDTAAGTVGVSGTGHGVRGRADTKVGVVGYIRRESGEVPQGSDGTGVAGFSAPGGVGLHGVGEDGGQGALGTSETGIGVTGIAPHGIGVLAEVGSPEGGEPATGVALKAEGPVLFSSSGLADVALNDMVVTVPSTVPITADAKVLATLQSDLGPDIHVSRVEPDYGGTSFEIHLSKKAKNAGKVAWFVIS